MGYLREECEALGVPFEQRTGRFAEAIRLILRLWTEDTVDFEGRYYRVRGAGLSLKPKRPGGPPIWLGGAAEPAIERAARLGDGWICSFRPTLPELTEQFATFRAARAAAGLAEPADYPICREVYTIGRAPV